MSIDSNEVVQTNRSKTGRQQTFSSQNTQTQSVAVANSAVGFQQVGVGKTLKRKVVKFSKNKPQKELKQNSNTAVMQYAEPEDGTNQFPTLLDYKKFLEPKTDRVFQFKSRRFDFCRRESHKEKMLMIIQFEGVIGEVRKKNLSDDNL